MWMIVDLTPPQRPSAYQAMTRIRLDGDVVGGVSRYPGDLQWTWFAIMFGNFRAGRAETKESAIAEVKAAALQLRDEP